VSYDGQVPTLRPLDMAADPVCAGKHDEPVMPQMLVLGDGNTLGNVFVKISEGAPSGSYPAPSEPAVIDQQGCVYHPHVLGMMAGQDLQFLNSDGILHNVHGLPKQNREFNIGMPANLTEKSVTLNQPEPLFPVKCDVHPWMNAYVAVMSHPFWAVTDEDGAYSIENLPAGTYTVEAWHERLGTQTSQITVADGEGASADFAFAPPAGG
jgi:plastocyanin